MRKLFSAAFAIFLASSAAAQNAAVTPQQDVFLTLMKKAAAHARANHDQHTPAISPAYTTVIGANPAINVKALHDAGFVIVPWTADDMDSIRALMALHVDGIISNHPEMLAQAMAEDRARAKAANDNAELAYLDRFDNEGHRGGRALRPENTLPAFEAGLDNGIHSIETDTGVTTDRQSLLWHDQYLNPESCRRADGQPYTQENRVYTRDISMVDAQKTFICDKLHTGPQQVNDLSLSPVAVAFAQKENMPSPYAPTYAAQLFRFVQFYTEFYSTGPGKDSPHAAERARTGRNVHFNLETKIVPQEYSEAHIAALFYGKTEAELKASGRLQPGSFEGNHTVDPQTFVNVLCGAIMKYHMEKRADVQSFDFRTLRLVEEQYPAIQTFYLTQDPRLMSTTFVPESLRAMQK